jgi:hypothetical protein
MADLIARSSSRTTTSAQPSLKSPPMGASELVTPLRLTRQRSSPSKNVPTVAAMSYTPPAVSPNGFSNGSVELSSTSRYALTMKIFKLALLTLLSFTTVQGAYSQCAPGVPSAGNPGCIPPNQSNSPYYQGGAGSPEPSAPQPEVTWKDQWGAVALDANTGLAGASENQASERRANSGALGVCEQQGGRSCKVILSYVNQCAAVAAPDRGDYVSSATAAKLDDAVSRATDRCIKRASSCQIIYRKCSMPVRAQ